LNLTIVLGCEVSRLDGNYARTNLVTNPWLRWHRHLVTHVYAPIKKVDR